jgi:Flp pilus assembly protein TadG
MTTRPLLKRFLTEKSGQFAIMFSLALFPILAGVGMAIDYSRLSQANVRLKDSTDAATFFASKYYREHGALPTMAQASDFLDANFAATGLEGTPVVDALTLNGNVINIKSHLVYPTMLMGVFGHSVNTLTADAGVTSDQDQPIEIAMVLDTTYSMTAQSGASGGQLDPTGDYLPPNTTNIDKLMALKVAALKFNGILFADPATSPLRRVAIVPFSRYVNVGLSRRNESWMSVAADTPSSGQTCGTPYYPVVAYSNVCHPETYTYDGVPVTYQACEPIYGTTQITDCWPTSYGQTWHGCVGSRNEPNNLKQGFGGNKFVGIMDAWCGTEVLPLTNDKVALAAQISSLYANDLTYIPEGVMWGWRMLTKEAPFTEAKQPQPNKPVRKIMVIMTDGENQASADIPAAPTHNSSNFGQADDWTTKACDNVKADGIEIYSVTFGMDISTTAKQIISGCASDPSHYYDAANAANLVSAFQSIASKVGAVRLTN